MTWENTGQCDPWEAVNDMHARHEENVATTLAVYQDACKLVLEVGRTYNRGQGSRQDFDAAKALWVEARNAWENAQKEQKEAHMGAWSDGWESEWEQRAALRESRIAADYETGDFGKCDVCRETSAFSEGVLGEAVNTDGEHVMVHVDCKPADWEWA